MNARVYAGVNNGVYRAGFARSQSAYDAAVGEVFATLDWLEERLARQRYLVGGRLTEADWRLATTLFRFDAVYHGHFKCNRDRLVDFPNLWGYARELYQVPGVAETVDFAQITQHYYASHEIDQSDADRPDRPAHRLAGAAWPGAAAGGLTRRLHPGSRHHRVRAGRIRGVR